MKSIPHNSELKNAPHQAFPKGRVPLLEWEPRHIDSAHGFVDGIIKRAIAKNEVYSDEHAIVYAADHLSGARSTNMRESLSKFLSDCASAGTDISCAVPVLLAERTSPLNHTGGAFSKNPVEKHIAMALLQASKNPATLLKIMPLLIESLRHNEEDVRATAAFTLSSAACEGNISDAIPHLANALEDEYAEVRAESLAALRRWAMRGMNMDAAIPALAFNPHLPMPATTETGQRIWFESLLAMSISGSGNKWAAALLSEEIFGIPKQVRDLPLYEIACYGTQDVRKALMGIMLKAMEQNWIGRNSEMNTPEFVDSVTRIADFMNDMRENTEAGK